VGESVFLFLAPSTEARHDATRRAGTGGVADPRPWSACAGDIEHNMIGESPAMREVYLFIAKVAPTETTVLIRGEAHRQRTGGQAIHRNSPR
jgi:DNA-binding NtrC family response regulator